MACAIASSPPIASEHIVKRTAQKTRLFIPQLYRTAPRAGGGAGEQPTRLSDTIVRNAYLRVQINCQQSDPALVSVVGHELQHVVEIACALSVVDDKSFTRLFRTIGFSTCWGTKPDRFETAAAVAASARVRAEYLHDPEWRFDASHRVAGRVNGRGGD